MKVEAGLGLERPHPLRSKGGSKEWVCGDGSKGEALSLVSLLRAVRLSSVDRERSRGGHWEGGLLSNPSGQGTRARVDHRLWAQLRVKGSAIGLAGGWPPSSFHCLG